MNTVPSIFSYAILLLLLSRFSHIRLCATPYTAAHQAPPSLGFSRQEHWSGLPFPSPMHESEKSNEVAQSCQTLSDPMDCSLPGSSVHGIFQARVLEWVAIAFHTYTLQCGKESAYNAGDSGDVVLIPGSGRYPGGGNGNPLQYSCLENPIDREAWRATVHWVTKSCTQLRD